jgi:hypothetical protein
MGDGGFLVTILGVILINSRLKAIITRRLLSKMIGVVGVRNAAVEQA